MSRRNAALIAELNEQESALMADLESRVRRQKQVDAFIMRTLVRLRRVRANRDAL